MNAILALDDAYRDRRHKYQQFLLVNRSRPPLDRATAWLQYTAADPDNYGDQEALVYLASRGLDVSRLIESTIEQWKQDEKALLLPAPADLRYTMLLKIRQRTPMAYLFLTRLGESGCDAWTLARIAGHSSVSISARYVHPSGDAVIAAMSRLGGHNFGHTALG